MHGAGPLSQGRRNTSIAGAEIERDRKLPLDQIEPVEQSLGNLDMQKIHPALPRCALAMRPPGAPVEEGSSILRQAHRAGFQSGGVS
jgi:hypothetical protein